MDLEALKQTDAIEKNKATRPWNGLRRRQRADGNSIIIFYHPEYGFFPGERPFFLETDEGVKGSKKRQPEGSSVLSRLHFVPPEPVVLGRMEGLHYWSSRGQACNTLLHQWIVKMIRLPRTFGEALATRGETENARRNERKLSLYSLPLSCINLLEAPGGGRLHFSA